LPIQFSRQQLAHRGDAEGPVRYQSRNLRERPRQGAPHQRLHSPSEETGFSRQASRFSAAVELQLAILIEMMRPRRIRASWSAGPRSVTRSGRWQNMEPVRASHHRYFRRTSSATVIGTASGAHVKGRDGEDGRITAPAGVAAWEFPRALARSHRSCAPEMLTETRGNHLVMNALLRRLHSVPGREFRQRPNRRTHRRPRGTTTAYAPRRSARDRGVAAGEPWCRSFYEGMVGRRSLGATNDLDVNAVRERSSPTCAHRARMKPSVLVPVKALNLEQANRVHRGR